MSYNGWTNYETWNVKLWLDNGGFEYEKSMGTTAFDLAEYLRDMIYEDMPEIGNNLYSDILTAAIQEVNFREIAEAMIEDNKDDADEDSEEPKE
jgi:hypothetical protein